MNVGVCLWKIRGCWEDIKKRKDMCYVVKCTIVFLFYSILFYFFTCYWLLRMQDPIIAKLFLGVFGTIKSFVVYCLCPF